MRKLRTAWEQFRTEWQMMIDEERNSVGSEEWDRTHYKNGFRKWSDYPLIDRVAFIFAVIALIKSFL